MKLITGIGGWPDEAGGQAVKAEANGYDMVTCGELSHDSILTMTLAAAATEKIELQTSVTIAFPRSGPGFGDCSGRRLASPPIEAG